MVLAGVVLEGHSQNLCGRFCLALAILVGLLGGGRPHRSQAGNPRYALTGTIFVTISVFVSGQLSGNFRATFKQLLGDFRATSGQLPDNFRATFGKFSGNIRATFGQLSDNFRATFGQLPSNFWATSGQVSGNFWATFVASVTTDMSIGQKH